MKRTFSVLFFASTALVSVAAHAAPVFMLQFGSFESRAEADSKLSALKSKHAGVLSRMQSGVREVNLPPDNLTVYRTQAGPLATRADAQSVCSQLASNGDECYVVETAMAPSFAPATTQVAEAAQAQVAQAAEQVSGAVLGAAAAATSSAANAVSSVSNSVTSTARDPQNVAVLNRVAGAGDLGIGTTAGTAAAVEASNATTALESDLNAAVAAQQSGGLPVAAAVAPAPVKKDRSLWDRIFGSDDEEEQVATVSAPRVPEGNVAVQAVPVEPITATAPMPVAVVTAPALPDPLLSAPNTPTPPGAVAERSVILPNTSLAPANAAMPTPSPVYVPVSDAPAAPVAVAVAQPAAPIVTEAQPFPLPPPPAPLVGQSRPVAAPLAAAPTPVGEPQTTGSLPQVALPPPPPPGPGPVLASNNVQVEEARRVPLSQNTVSPSYAPPPPPVAVAPAAPAIMPAALSPAATLGRKTLWAQVGPFRSQQEALAYWENYRRNNPDFPVVRVRVTTPMMAQERDVAHSTLRIGPFAQGGFIKALCGTFVQDKLQCGTVTDMGISSGSKARGILPTSRYNR